MSSPLLIAYPDIPWRAAGVASTIATDDWHPHYNLFKGQRYHHARFASTSSDREIKFTMNDGEESSVSYAILARADLLIDQGVTQLLIASSSDDASYTNRIAYTPIVGDLVGPRQQDIVQTITETSDFKYWRTRLQAPSAVLRYSKLYFGNMFDMGVAPSDFDFELTEPTQRPFVADSTASHYVQMAQPRYRLRITWDGVSDAVKDSFVSKIVFQKEKKGFFLYTTDQHHILNDVGLLHVQLTASSVEETVGYPNWNRISCVFDEVLG